MSDIEFDCPECGGALVIDAAGTGLTVNCNLCSKPIRVPKPEGKRSESGVKFACPRCSQQMEAPPEMLGTVIACPACDRQIQVPHPVTVPNPPQLPPSFKIQEKANVTCQQRQSSLSNDSTGPHKVLSNTRLWVIGGCAAVTLALVSIIFVVPGIRSHLLGDQSTSYNGGAPTARDAVITMFKAIEDNNKAAYRDVVYFGRGNEQLGEAQFDRLAAQDSFYKKYIQVYNEQKVFEGAIPVHTSDDGGFIISCVPTREEMAGMQVVENGDKAKAQIVVGIIPIIRKNGQWRVDLCKNFKYNTVAALEKEAANYTKVKANIGQSGYTGDKIFAELIDGL